MHPNMIEKTNESPDDEIIREFFKNQKNSTPSSLLRKKILDKAKKELTPVGMPTPYFNLIVSPRLVSAFATMLLVIGGVITITSNETPTGGTETAPKLAEVTPVEYNAEVDSLLSEIEREMLIDEQIEQDDWESSIAPELDSLESLGSRESIST